MKEKLSSIERAAGSGSELESQSVLEDMSDIFSNQEEYKKTLENKYLEEFGSLEKIPDELIKTIFFERPKTPEEVQMISLANQITNDLRKRFELPEINIPQGNIYVVPKDAPWPSVVKGDEYYLPMGQLIVIHEQENNQGVCPNIVFIKSLIHAMMHFKSFNSIKKIENILNYNVQKTGFDEHDKDNNSLEWLNEGVTEEQTRYLLDLLKKHPLLENEVTSSERIFQFFSDKKTKTGEPLLSGDEYYAHLDQEKAQLWIAHFTYSEERSVLNNLVKKIVNSEKNNFKSNEDVLDVFLKAYFSGNTADLEKLLDETFERGFFKNLINANSDLDKLRNYIDNF